MTSIGVVIVSFNTCELLRGCLDSLRGCALPLRVVVVENASRDESAAMVRACFPASRADRAGAECRVRGGNKYRLAPSFESEIKDKSSGKETMKSDECPGRHGTNSKLRTQQLRTQTSIMCCCSTPTQSSIRARSRRWRRSWMRTRASARSGRGC